jgi:hypothetical protein
VNVVVTAAVSLSVSPIRPRPLDHVLHKVVPEQGIPYLHMLSHLLPSYFLPSHLATFRGGKAGGPCTGPCTKKGIKVSARMHATV